MVAVGGEGCMSFCFLKTMCYYRGNVVHLPAKKEEAKNHSRFFGSPGYAYGPTRYFPSPRKRTEEISRLTAILGL
jgi:hypothetical protein